MVFARAWDETIPPTVGAGAEIWKGGQNNRYSKIDVRERETILTKQDGTDWKTKGHYSAIGSAENSIALPGAGALGALKGVDFKSTQAADWLFEATLQLYSPGGGAAEFRFKLGAGYVGVTFNQDVAGEYHNMSCRHIEQAVAAGNHTLEFHGCVSPPEAAAAAGLVVTATPILVDSVT